MRLDRTWPNSSDVGGSANEEEQDDDHAIEAEECALNKCWITIDVQ